MEIFNYKYLVDNVIIKRDVIDYLNGKLLSEEKLKVLEKLKEYNPKILDKIIKSEKVLAIEGNNLYFVEARGKNGYYKLRSIGNTEFTTLEINGIHMHRISDVDPLTDAYRKIRAVRVRGGDRVLDICTGLGYTALASSGRGAKVTSIEFDENVLWIAERNPLSRGLENKNIVIILGDAYEVLDELPINFYDKVIHDPPRFSEGTGLLYSTEFYLKLFKVMKKGSLLYHYTGESGRLRKIHLPGKVASRLKKVGFEIIKYDKLTYGIIARKI